MTVADPRRAGRAARRKGNAFELWLSKRFASYGLVGLDRVPNSGGLKIKCDLRNRDGSSYGLAIEAKAQENLPLWKCLRQTLAQSRAHEIPILIFKRDRRAGTDAAESTVWACLPLDDLLGLIAEREGVLPLRAIEEAGRYH